MLNPLELSEQSNSTITLIEPIDTNGDYASVKQKDIIREAAEKYSRYHIETEESPDLQPLPNRFIVKVGKFGLAKLLFKEFFAYFGKWDVVFSRPCVYGVFSGPVGGFSPRPHLCVGCLRCTIQHPDFVKILHNPKLASVGDSYFDAKKIHTIHQESSTGNVPVKGQGFRGKFGGKGWDGMWTDMSEIVRPTRDGIHGRESISTITDLGSKPMSLDFENNQLNKTRIITIDLPILFDIPPIANLSEKLCLTLVKSANKLGTIAILPYSSVREQGLQLEFPENIAPILNSTELSQLVRGGWSPKMIVLDSYNEEILESLRVSFPSTIVSLRIKMGEINWIENMVKAAKEGVDNIHLLANYHGKGVDESGDDSFVLDLLISAHKKLVSEGIRDKISLVGSGGIIQAEHVPKALICGLDAIALDTPVMIGMQAIMEGDCISQENSKFKLPKKFSVEWGTQRVVNLMASWRDQLLEIMGAMGLREVRRLRGEIGRAMFQNNLEIEAFGDIEGFVPKEVIQ
tara:strand:- start:169 stop:1716 length:1548 start_codon:yes stop_codon:yes gene_type:complete